MDEIAGKTNDAPASPPPGAQPGAPPGAVPGALPPGAGGPGDGASAGDAVGPDTGILCLAMMLQFHKMASDPAQLAHEYGPAAGTIDLLGLVRAAKQIGLKSRTADVKMSRLQKAPLPAIAEAGDGTFFILARANEDKALIQVPGQPPETLTHDELAARWTGRAFVDHAARPDRR